MWELKKLSSYMGNPMRSILAYALSAIIAAFLWVLLVIPAVHAADAGWNGSNVTYNNHTYEQKKSDGKTPPTMSAGMTYYRYIDPFAGNGGRIYIIFFPSGSENTATLAQFIGYDANSDGGYANKVEEKTVSISPKNTAIASGTAAWEGVNLKFDNKTYTGKNGGPRISVGSNPQIPSGSKYYLNIDGPNEKAHIIYFGANDNEKTTTKAQLVTFNFDGTNWTNGTTPRSIDVATQADSVANTPGQVNSQDGVSSCNIDGVGWIICPVSNFLAWGMDHIFEMLKGFLVVKPLTTQANSLYPAWNYIRSFANVAFVIAFLIIIYSQLTSLGISNYGIKKLLPRLIVAAILVNVSYYICAIAVDLSNVIGDSLQKLFVIMREQMASGSNQNTMYSWQSVTGFLLSGGTIAAATAAGITGLVITSGASAGAAVILLLPMLLGLLLAVLVALIVLAARQAVITLLIIVAPLAFIAYLLPNTEKWFEKWRSTFMTLLVFFPLFALIFGGSQLAGFLIRQNTDQINIVLLAMFVQVAPLILTPLLVKFSGNIVSRIAGFINNPNKGLIDRTKKWTKEQSEHMAAKNMARRDPVRDRQVFRRFALGLDQQKRIRDARKSQYGAISDARWANSRDFSDIDQGTRFAQDEKQLGESSSELRYNASKAVAGAIQNLDVDVRSVKLNLDNAKLETDANWERNHNPAIMEQKLRSHVLGDTIAALKSTHDAEYEEFRAGQLGRNPATANIAQMLTQAQDDVRRVALNGMRNSLAKQVQLENRNEELAANTIYIDGQRLRTYAGGIHTQGADRAYATALVEQHKARADSIANANAIIEHSNLSAAQTLELAKNNSVNGIVVGDEIREAAIKRVASNGVIPHIDELMRTLDLSPTGNENFRTTFVDAYKANSARSKYHGFGFLDQLTQGIPGGYSQATTDSLIEKMLIEGKLSAKELVSQDRDTLDIIRNSLSRIPRTPAFSGALAGLKSEIADAQGNAQLWNTAGERKSVIEDIDRQI